MPTRPPSRCSVPLCPALATHRGKCAAHQPEPWAGRATTQQRYGMSGSAQQSLHRDVLKAAEYMCYRCGLPGADTVDHIIAISDGGSKAGRSNLGAIHQEPCHREKTDEENARRRARRAAQRNA